MSVSRAERQQQVLAWVRSTFGDGTCSVEERARRFLEEAIELAQACNLSQDGVQALVKYVYSRPAGNQQQEVGGVGVSLLGLCEVLKIDADSEEATELHRVLSLDPQYFRDRHNAKADKGVATPTDDHHAQQALSGPVSYAVPVVPALFTLAVLIAVTVLIAICGVP